MSLSKLMNENSGSIKTQTKQIKELQQMVAQQHDQIQNIYGAYQKSQEQLLTYRSLEYRRKHIEQCIDFAIHSMNKNFSSLKTSDVLAKAKEYHESITAESERLVEADRIEYEAKQKEAEERRIR